MFLSDQLYQSAIPLYFVQRLTLLEAVLLFSTRQQLSFWYKITARVRARSRYGWFVQKQTWCLRSSVSAFAYLQRSVMLLMLA